MTITMGNKAFIARLLIERENQCCFNFTRSMSFGIKHFDWLILVTGPLSCICPLTLYEFERIISEGNSYLLHR